MKRYWQLTILLGLASLFAVPTSFAQNLLVASLPFDLYVDNISSNAPDILNASFNVQTTNGNFGQPQWQSGMTPVFSNVQPDINTNNSQKEINAFYVQNPTGTSVSGTMQIGFTAQFVNAPQVQVIGSFSVSVNNSVLSVGGGIVQATNETCELVTGTDTNNFASISLSCGE